MQIDHYLCDAAGRIRHASAASGAMRGAVEIVGRSGGLVRVLDRLEKFAPFSEPVLITGESGTGKEGIAQACYLMGRAARMPF